MKDSSIERRFEGVARSTTFKNLCEYFDLDSRVVLDIGCSYGEFLFHFGPGSVGLTVAQEEAAYATKRGLDVRCGNIESKDLELGKTFDVVFANNIFEHLYSPHEFLRTVRRFLKPDGLLILGVPCIPRLTFLLRFRKFRGSLADAHINFFTYETLAKTVERGGWRLHMLRGFRFKSAILEWFINPLYPHFYAICSIDPHFRYSVKREKELAGYGERPH